MSKRRDLETQLRSLTEIKEIMNAMKNLSLMEAHRLTHFLDTQQRVVASIEAAAADFLSFYTRLVPGDEESRNFYIVLGSERGFCGDFNESLLQALERHVAADGHAKVIAVGNKLAAKLAGDSRFAAFVDGASVVEEVDPVLVKLMQTLTDVSGPSAVKLPLRLTVFHHDALEESVKISALRPFHKQANVSRFSHAPLLYLEPQPFLMGLAEQYLFAVLHALLYSSLMAENQRRIQHMDAAVQRLERTSGDLLQKRNILRQEEITEEIEVIMLSVEALK